jgi:uncharacterized protein YoxC
MQLWEYVVLFVGVALIALVIYLIIAVKKLHGTIDQINHMITENEKAIASILANADAISEDAKNVLDKVGTVVTRADKVAGSLKNDGGLSSMMGIGSISDIFGAAYAGYKLLKKYREKRKLKKLLKESKRI